MKFSFVMCLVYFLFCLFSGNVFSKPSSSYIKVNGVKLHYLHQGKKGNPLIIFLHGFPEYSGVWSSYLPNFEKDYYAVAPDMRGYNLSEKPSEFKDYTLGKLTDDIKGLIQRLGHKKARIVAHDWGGVVGWYFATRFPKLVEHLIIMNAPYPKIYGKLFKTNKKQMKSGAYIAMLTSKDGATKVRANNYEKFRKAYFDETTAKLTEEEKNDQLKAWAQPMAIESSIKYYIASFLFKKQNRALIKNNVVVPTLVLWGLNDSALVPENLDGLYKYVSPLTIKTYKNATHWINIEMPLVLSKEIKNFIEK
jgi:pimeloyl-ACP methyl ester carboxylesterase